MSGQLLAAFASVHGYFVQDCGEKGRLGMLLWMATSMGAVVGWIMSNFARWLGKGG